MNCHRPRHGSRSGRELARHTQQRCFSPKCPPASRRTSQPPPNGRPDSNPPAEEDKRRSSVARPPNLRSRSPTVPGVRTAVSLFLRRGTRFTVKDMSWDVHTRQRPRSDDHAAHVKANWTALGTINDVILDAGRGVRTSSGASVRRSMNAFSKPIEADFSWEDDVE